MTYSAVRSIVQFGGARSGFAAGTSGFAFLGRPPPVLAGLGRMKVNSKVPPIARVCGFPEVVVSRRQVHCANGG